MNNFNFSEGSFTPCIRVDALGFQRLILTYFKIQDQVAGFSGQMTDHTYRRLVRENVSSVQSVTARSVEIQLARFQLVEGRKDYRDHALPAWDYLGKVESTLGINIFWALVVGARS